MNLPSKLLQGMDTVTVAEIIITTIRRRGVGKTDDPHRVITEFWDREGNKLAELDPCVDHLTPFGMCVADLLSQNKRMIEQRDDIIHSLTLAGQESVANKENAEVYERRSQRLAAEVSRLREAIAWALGENGDFDEAAQEATTTATKPYWWRSELRKRAEFTE